MFILFSLASIFSRDPPQHISLSLSHSLWYGLTPPSSTWRVLKMTFSPSRLSIFSFTRHRRCFMNNSCVLFTLPPSPSSSRLLQTFTLFDANKDDLFAIKRPADLYRYFLDFSHCENINWSINYRWRHRWQSNYRSSWTRGEKETTFQDVSRKIERKKEKMIMRAITGGGRLETHRGNATVASGGRWADS